MYFIEDIRKKKDSEIKIAHRGFINQNLSKLLYPLFENGSQVGIEIEFYCWLLTQ